MGKSIIEVQQVSPAAIELIPFGDGKIHHRGSAGFTCCY
jgi:hypothetical protein